MGRRTSPPGKLPEPSVQPDGQCEYVATLVPSNARVTFVASGTKPEPVTDTRVPLGPDEGVRVIEGESARTGFTKVDETDSERMTANRIGRIKPRFLFISNIRRSRQFSISEKETSQEDPSEILIPDAK